MVQFFPAIADFFDLFEVRSAVESSLSLQPAAIVTHPHCEAESQIEENEGGNSIEPVHCDRCHDVAEVANLQRNRMCKSTEKCPLVSDFFAFPSYRAPPILDKIGYNLERRQCEKRALPPRPLQIRNLRIPVRVSLRRRSRHTCRHAPEDLLKIDRHYCQITAHFHVAAAIRIFAFRQFADRGAFVTGELNKH